jgi:hypothetical protein
MAKPECRQRRSFCDADRKPISITDSSSVVTLMLVPWLSDPAQSVKYRLKSWVELRLESLVVARRARLEPTVAACCVEPQEKVSPSWCATPSAAGCCYDTLEIDAHPPVDVPYGRNGSMTRSWAR